MSISNSGKSRTILPFLLLLTVSVWVLNSLSKGWFGPQSGGALGWILLAAFVTGILLYPIPIMRMKQKAIAAATLGDYEEALRISRKWLGTATYGPKFQGWIMLAAGRYSEALKLLKEGAFDEKGRPLLNSQYLHYYAIALMSEERYSEAQRLLEEAVVACQKNGDYLRFSLAECLLSQNKEAERALRLVDEGRARLTKKGHSKSGSLVLAQCNVIRAWALAGCGRREEANTALEEAFAESESFSKDDLAGLLNSKGSACQALGDSERARKAFQESLAVFPHGSHSVDARTGLAELGEHVHK